MFRKNIGRSDRIIRVAVGALIAAFGIVNMSWWGLLALIPLGTAATGFCGLYRMLGINTCEADRPTGRFGTHGQC